MWSERVSCGAPRGFHIGSSVSIPFSLLYFTTIIDMDCLFISDIDECSQNSRLCSHITATCKKIQGNYSGAFAKQNLGVMDTIAQVLNRFQSVMPCRVRLKSLQNWPKQSQYVW